MSAIQSRASNPNLPVSRKSLLVGALMDARRAVRYAKRSGDRAAEDEAHAAVDIAKVAFGEGGAPWWADGAPDLNRHMARTTRYASWYAPLAADRRDL